MPKLPKVRHAKSLLQMSLDLIARMFVDNTDDKNLDKNDVEETCTDPIEEEGQSVLKCISNPFEKLPSACLVQIFNTFEYNYGQQNMMKHYSLLITPQTRVVDLVYFTVKDESSTFQLMQLAATQSPQLTHLRANHMCPLEGYLSFLPHFKNLEVLDVSGSKNFNDSCMQILGFHCQHLRELDIRCCNVTDDGIEWLFGQCKSIEELTTYDTKVTRKGVETALRNLPLLKILHPNNGLSVIEALIAIYQNASVCAKYALTELAVEGNSNDPLLSGYKNGHLWRAASLCPFVTHLEIDISLGVTDSDLLGLVVVEGLSHLKLVDNCSYEESNEDCCITFDFGLAPLLKARGSSLKSLELARFRPSVRVRLGIITECCRNLTRLVLDTIYLTRIPTKSKTEWNQLELLKLVDANGCYLPHHIEELLQLSPHTLKKLMFHYSDYVDDELLHQVFQFNSFNNLEELVFEFCSSVTKDGIDLFLTGENSLNCLSVYDCELVSEEDIENWVDKAEKNNWDFRFEE